MNINIIRYVISNMLKLNAALLIIPLCLSFYYGEGVRMLSAYLIPIFLILVLSFVLFPKKSDFDEQSFHSKEGYLIVALSWILLSFLSSLPFVFSGFIENINDAFFETVSGFTTTGATILTNPEGLPNSLLFWRSFTHFVGGMGVLVLVLAIMPKGKKQSMYILKAEVPGPTVGKLVSKMSYNSRILYIIYIVITLSLVLALYLAGMPLFDSFIHAFGAAGTGGFSSKNVSIAYYSSPIIEYILSIGMLMFGLNFNLYYLIILGNVKQAFKSEEARWYFSIVAIATLIICFDLAPRYDSIENLFRDSLFTVSSIMTTTGYSTADFNLWPHFSQLILLALMFIGACAGSTAGGLKISRVIVLVKEFFRQVKKTANTNIVKVIKLDGKTMDNNAVSSILSYFILYVGMFLFFLTCVSITMPDFTSAFSAVAATYNNIGPGLGIVGPTSSYAELTQFTKFILSFSMLFGRLEILPMIILFSPSTYRKLA